MQQHRDLKSTDTNTVNCRRSTCSANHSYKLSTPKQIPSNKGGSSVGDFPVKLYCFRHFVKHRSLFTEENCRDAGASMVTFPLIERPRKNISAIRIWIPPEASVQDQHVSRWLRSSNNFSLTMRLTAVRFKSRFVSGIEKCLLQPSILC